jgi:hypothetical protein
MKKNLLKFVSILSFITFLPIIAFADTTCGSLTGILKIVCQIKEILNAIVPVLIVLGMVYFIWGVIKYVIADGEEAKKKGKDIMIYGIIGFVAIVGLWGIVNMVVTTLGGAGTAPTVDTIGGVSGSCTVPTSGASDSTFQKYLTYITCIINSSIIPIIFAGAAVMFIWGVVNFFILNADEEAKRAQGKQFMLWGIIALAVMLSVWGLVGVLKATFGIDVGTSFLPQTTPPH